MVKVLTVEDVIDIVDQIGIHTFIGGLIDQLRLDYSRWQQFKKIPRLATHCAEGVMELMPISDNDYFACKYVNGHPLNPQKNKQTVVAMGLLAETVTGYPLLVSEMTLLTAFRTAANSALAGQYFAKDNASSMALIGTGAQAEFQVLAFAHALQIRRIQYFDIDPYAMKKFQVNLSRFDLELVPCTDARSAVHKADIVTTATAAAKRAIVLHNDWLEPGMFINALGGDCPGKTELDPAILARVKLIAEYREQTTIEGEVQQHIDPKNAIYAELWEVIMDRRPGRVSDDEIILFDGVGFAMEDYSVLKYVYQLSERLGIGREMDLVPTLEHPKNLFGVLN